MSGPFTDGEGERFYVLTHWLETLSYENRAQLEELFDYRIRLHDYFRILDPKEPAKLRKETKKLAKERNRRIFHKLRHVIKHPVDCQKSKKYWGKKADAAKFSAKTKDS